MEKCIEYPSVGLSYHEDKYGVYEYDIHPDDSVLAGQVRRVFLDWYDTEEEAVAAHPDAERGCHPGFDRVAHVYNWRLGDNDDTDYGDDNFYGEDY